jgi:hypothetical protein
LKFIGLYRKTTYSIEDVSDQWIHTLMMMVIIIVSDGDKTPEWLGKGKSKVVPVFLFS